MVQKIAPLAGRRVFITIGNPIVEPRNNLGFYIEDDTLYALTAREGVGYTTEPYGTIALDTRYLLEAHLIPGAVAIFKLNGKEFARIMTNLPTGTTKGRFMMVRIENPAVAEDKRVDIGVWEVRMRRIPGVYG